MKPLLDYTKIRLRTSINDCCLIILINLYVHNNHHAYFKYMSYHGIYTFNKMY